MSQASAMACLERARSSIRHVLNDWDAASLARMEECRALLEVAVGELRAFEASPARDASAANGLDSTARQLKRDIVTLMRVVDAGSAFYRGLALRLGSSAPSYTASGHSPEEVSSPARVAIQV